MVEKWHRPKSKTKKKAKTKAKIKGAGKGKDEGMDKDTKPRGHPDKQTPGQEETHRRSSHQEK